MDFRSTVGLSLAFSLMLTSQFFSAAPEGFISAAAAPALDVLKAAGAQHGAALPTLQAPTSAPAARDGEQKIDFLSEDQLKKLIKFCETRNFTVSFDDDIAAELEVKGTDTYAAIRFKFDGAYHHFARYPGDTAFFFGYSNAEETRVLRIERDARLTRAVLKKGATTAVKIPRAQAAEDARRVLQIWSRAANALKDS